MPFRKIRNRVVFMSDIGEKNSKDIDLISKGFSSINLEEISKLDDDVIRENIIELKSGEPEELLYLKHRPDLVSAKKLKDFKILNSTGELKPEQKKEIFG